MATKKATKAPKRESIFIAVGYDGNYAVATSYSYDVKGATSNWYNEQGDALLAVIEVSVPAREAATQRVIKLDL